MNAGAIARWGELAKVFLKLGFIGFGGPAAVIAMMDDEIVTRRQWLTRSQYFDLVGTTNLIPGPNSTQIALHIGLTYGGFPGLFIAGLSFIVPASLITGGFAWLYVQFGALPQVEPFLAGIQPAVLAIIAAALWRLGKQVIQSYALLLIACGIAGFLWAGVHEVMALLVGAFLGMVGLQLKRHHFSSFLLLVVGMTATQTVTATITPTLWKLGWFFFQISCVLFGGGYVLVAFIERQLVQDYQWLTQEQLLDAIAIGQFTPGPLFSAATFIGYLILGFPGAVVATVGIFLPSFFLVAILNPIIPKLRHFSWTADFLDAVNAGAIALMAMVTIQLSQSTLVDLPAWLIAIAAGILAIFWQVNAASIILGSAILGYCLYILS